MTASFFFFFLPVFKMHKGIFKNAVFVFWVGGTVHCAIQHVGSQFPDQGWNTHAPPWKRRVLTTGPPDKSYNSVLKNRLSMHMIQNPESTKSYAETSPCPKSFVPPCHPDPTHDPCWSSVTPTPPVSLAGLVPPRPHP